MLEYVTYSGILSFLLRSSKKDEEDEKMNTGNTAFMLISTAFVFFMTPGLAFFYGGLVRRKNVCSTMMACVAIMGLSVVMWSLFGYSLSFGGNYGGVIGDLRWFGLGGVGMEPGAYAPTIPHLVFCAFQMMFAMITPALITGALVGRMRFKALFLFVAFWSLIVYYPLAHMVWGQGGFLASIGSVDFAGGNVVHISSGVSALTLAIILGRRKGYEFTTYRIHNIPFVVLGASMLWFGWFGFNAGSALEANGLAAHAFMTSAISSACALLSWMLIDVIKSGKPTLVGASTGLVVGLVAITSGSRVRTGLVFVCHWFSGKSDLLFRSGAGEEKTENRRCSGRFWMPWHWRDLGRPGYRDLCGSVSEQRGKMERPCFRRISSASGSGGRHTGDNCSGRRRDAHLRGGGKNIYSSPGNPEGGTDRPGYFPAWRKRVSQL